MAYGYKKKYRSKVNKKKFRKYGKKPRHGTKTVITKYRW